jgi:hypothetical protein
MIIYSNNNYNEKYWAVFGLQLSGLTADTDYWAPDY